VLASKSELLNSLIDYRVNDIEVIYTDFLNNNKIDNKTKDIIEEFINKINSDENKFRDDQEGKDYENYKQYKINEIKMLLFNNQSKITSDISLFLTTNLVDYIKGVTCGQVPPELVFLTEQEGELAPVLITAFPGDAAQHLGGPGCGMKQSGKHLERGGLSGPVGSQKADEFTLGDVEGDVLYGMDGFVFAME
jgi:hypothetical protein